MSEFKDGEIVNIVLRMVVPIRREFGRQVDVQQFLHDSNYAQVVLEEALTSKDERLRKFAVYVSERLVSPRVAARVPSPTPVEPDAPAGPSAAAAPSLDNAVPSPTGDTNAEREMRERVIDKYRRGLR